MIAAFIGSGGGVAFALRYGVKLNPLLAGAVGAAAGFALAAALFTLFVRLFIQSAGGGTRSAYALVDSLAKVSVAVPQKGTGRIDFVASGRRQTMAARTATGSAIPKGSPVVVLRLEQGVAYVAETGDGKEAPWAQ
jgi:hypothetical protein